MLMAGEVIAFLGKGSRLYSSQVMWEAYGE